MIARWRLCRFRADLVVVHGVAIPGRRPVLTDVITPQLRLPLVVTAFVALSSSHGNDSERSPSRERVVVVALRIGFAAPAPILPLCMA